MGHLEVLQATLGLLFSIFDDGHHVLLLSWEENHST
jgi:hypothetical protein